MPRRLDDDLIGRLAVRPVRIARDIFHTRRRDECEVRRIGYTVSRMEPEIDLARALHGEVDGAAVAMAVAHDADLHAKRSFSCAAMRRSAAPR